MGSSAATRARVLRTISSSPAPLACADLAPMHDLTPEHMWVVTRDLRAAGSIRIGGWLVGGKRAPMFDTRVELGDVPRPEAVTRAESFARWRARLQADPVRHKAYRRKENERARKLTPAQNWCWNALRQLTGARSAAEIAARAGVAVGTAKIVLRALHKRTPRLVRIGGWMPTGSRPAPLYDLCVKREDAPPPAKLTSAERCKRSRTGQSKPKGKHGTSDRRASPQTLPIHAPPA